MDKKVKSARGLIGRPVSSAMDHFHAANLLKEALSEGLSKDQLKQELLQDNGDGFDDIPDREALVAKLLKVVAG